MSLPATMRYVDHGTGGGPEVLRMAEGPVPVPAAGEILIRVAWAGVNRPDCAQRAGSYPPPPGASKILGLEAAGEVVAVGAGTGRWRVGDQVCALCNGGAYAEYVTVPGTQALPIPSGLDLAEAAGVPENYFTVWTNVFDRGHLAAGERFLVHGGSSGIGLTAIRMAKAFGATVFTTVGNAEKAAFCREAGADHVIEYRTQDFVAEIERITGGEGVNLVLDMVGGEYTPRNLRVLAIEGRLVQIAFLGGPKIANFNMTPIMVRRLTVTGSTLRPRSAEDKAAIARSLEEQIWPRMAAGEVRPTVHARFPMAEARAAHELMETSRHIGKILLQVA